MDKYICSELGQPTSDGFILCKTWVIQPPSIWDSLALTHSQAVVIGGLIFSFLLSLIIFSALAKTVNEL